MLLCSNPEDEKVFCSNLEGKETFCWDLEGKEVFGLNLENKDLFNQILTMNKWMAMGLVSKKMPKIDFVSVHLFLLVDSYDLKLSFEKEVQLLLAWS